MATADPVQSIKADVTCPICLELFQDPVTTDCGHSFCKECIAQHGKEEINVACPQCKKRFQRTNLRSNRELRNIVESMPRLLRMEIKKEAGRGIQCETHQEPLKLYCKDDQILLCVVCERSQVHRAHTVVPKEEAAREYREIITKLKKELQSANDILCLLEGKETVQEEEHNRLTDKNWLPGSSLKSFSSGKKIAGETKLQKHKETKSNRKQVCKKEEETANHVIHLHEEFSVPNKKSLDPLVHKIRNTTEDAEHAEVGVMSLRQRFEGLRSPKESLQPGLKRGMFFNSSGKTRAVEVSSKEKRKAESAGEKVSENPSEVSSHVGEEPQTPKCGISQTPQDLTSATMSPTEEKPEEIQVTVMGLRQRFEGPQSPKDSHKSVLISGKRLTSSQRKRIERINSEKNSKRESAGEKVFEKQKEASSHGGEEIQTPKRDINETSQDLTSPSVNPTMKETEDNQVDVMNLRQRFEGPTSPKESHEVVLRSRKLSTSSPQTQAVHVGAKGNRRRESVKERVSEKQETASSHVGEKTQTPKHDISQTSQDLTSATVSQAVEKADDIQVNVTLLRRRHGL